MNRKNTVLLVLWAGILSLGFMGCTLGTPPECALGFSIDPPGILSIPYSITNIGSVDLKNCKIKLSIIVDTAPATPGLQSWTYEAWTNGVNLDVGETHNGTYYSPYTSYNIDSATIIAAGFANPEDEKKSIISSIAQ